MMLSENMLTGRQARIESRQQPILEDKRLRECFGKSSSPTRKSCAEMIACGLATHFVQLDIEKKILRYNATGQDTLVLAGEEYSRGSSKDWAAKGPMLLIFVPQRNMMMPKS